LGCASGNRSSDIEHESVGSQARTPDAKPFASGWWPCLDALRKGATMMTPKRKIFHCAIYTRKSTEHNLDLEFNSFDA
jgi:hypothetical protein